VRSALVLAVLACLPAAAARADEGADAILRELGLKPSMEIVAVDAARRPDGSVAVTLTPEGATKLVADPGVSVVPVDRQGLPVADAVTLKDSSREYFALPPVVEVAPGDADALRVEYAYCIVAKQCLFGDVTVPVPGPG
jgi:hypothetical protein